MDDAEARAVLRAHEEEPTGRGRLSNEARARAQFLADQDAGEGDTYDGGTSPEDFAPETVAAEPPPLPAERKPRKVRQARRPGFRDRVKAATAGKPKRKHPRVSLVDLIGTFWGGMGAAVARVDAPVGRTLIMQADAAGDIMEDAVRGTVVDRALQPIARNYERGRKVGALLGPPVIVAAIEVAQRLPEDQMKMRMALLEPMLVSSLMLWDDVAAEKAEARLARGEAQRPKLEQAQRLARLIFAPPPETVPDDETAAA